jgi:hypothetical protein
LRFREPESLEVEISSSDESLKGFKEIEKALS